jgi:hypothetical protein
MRTQQVIDQKKLSKRQWMALTDREAVLTAPRSVNCGSSA